MLNSSECTESESAIELPTLSQLLDNQQAFFDMFGCKPVVLTSRASAEHKLDLNILVGLFEAYCELSNTTKRDSKIKISEELAALKTMLQHFATPFNPTEADKAVAIAFTKYMNAFAVAGSDYKNIEGLNDALNSIETATTQTKKPMHPALKAIIGGIICAAIGAVIGAAVGAGLTWYASGIGAIPGFFVGLVKGFMVGSAGSTGIAAAIGGAGLISAGLFGGINYKARKAVDAANAPNTLSTNISADVNVIRQLAKKAS